MRRMLVTVRWPGVRMAPISSISAWRQLRWKNSGAKQRITPAKRAGSRSMAAVLWRERPSLTAHPLRCFRPGNGQTQDKSQQVTQFSDSIVVSYRVDEEAAIFRLLSEVAFCVIDLVERGFLLRGAIT